MTADITWCGELGQDRLVAEILHNKTNGYFVEFGAMNGRQYSNTYTLEKHFGWQGIVSEPNPRFHPELYEHRSCVIDDRAVYDISGEYLDFVCLPHGYSGLAQAGVRYDHSVIQVPSVSLNDLLKEHGAPTKIDYISMDTEGSELTILRSFDWSRYRVKIWTIEHNHKEPARSSTREIMREHGYQVVREKDSRYDDWFVHESVL